MCYLVCIKSVFILVETENVALLFKKNTNDVQLDNTYTGRVDVVHNYFE